MVCEIRHFKFILCKGYWAHFYDFFLFFKPFKNALRVGQASKTSAANLTCQRFVRQAYWAVLVGTGHQNFCTGLPLVQVQWTEISKAVWQKGRSVQEIWCTGLLVNSLNSGAKGPKATAWKGHRTRSCSQDLLGAERYGLDRLVLLIWSSCLWNV